MIIIFTEEELESVAELPRRLQKSTSVKNIRISHLFMKENLVLVPNSPCRMSYMMWQCEEDVPTVLSVNTSDTRTI